MDFLRKNLNTLTYLSIASLALGLFSSMTFSALAHIFIIIPLLFMIKHTDFKKWSMSQWSLLVLIVVMIASVVLNQDIAAKGFSPITKTKYYIISLFSILPLSVWYNSLSEGDRQKKIALCLKALIITATVAGICGYIGFKTGVNPISRAVNTVGRNSGFAGMPMNFAQNLVFLVTLALGLIIFHRSFKKVFEVKWLIVLFLINLFALYTTYTRGPLLAFLVSIPFYFMRKTKVFIAIVVASLVVGTGTYFIAKDKLSRPGSDVERISQWKAAIAGFKERPVLGLGFMNFESMSLGLKNKYHIEAAYYGGHAHSNYLELLASTGVLGFIAFMLWQIFWFKEMYQRKDLLGDMVMPLIVVFVVAGLTQATFTLGANLFLIMSLYAYSQVNLQKR